MKQFFVKNKKKILSGLFLIVIVATITVLSLLILQTFGIVYYEDGIKVNQELFNSFKNSWYGWLIIILIQIGVTTLLSFIPGTSMAFILVLQAMFDNPWEAFFLAFTGVMLSSFLMYVVGRYGGYTVCKKLLGEKECERASDLLNNKGTMYFPLMMLFPVFPDDALVMVAGTLKFSLKWFIPSIIIGRGIGIATIVFGLGNIPYDKFTSIWHWIIFVLVCAILIIFVFFLAYKLNNYLEKRGKNKTESPKE